MGAAVLREILRFRPPRRGRRRRLLRGGSLVLLLVAAGFTGGLVLADRPAGDGGESPPIGADGCDLWAYNESRFALAISAVRGSIPTNCQGEVIHFKFLLSSRIN